jgi:hypothetical protein
MSTQIDIKHALSAKYGAEADFPSWTTPFIHAVGLLEKLEEHVIPPQAPSKLVSRSTDLETGLKVKEISPVEEEMDRMEKEIVANLESVSIDGISLRVLI